MRAVRWWRDGVNAKARVPQDFRAISARRFDARRSYPRLLRSYIMHEVREFAGHADIRTTEVYFVRMVR
jgi:hypothetical protein